MNICIKTVFFALIFILADIYLLVTMNKKNITNPFINSLDVEKKQRYENIVEERTLIYIKSIFIGLLISIVYFMILPKGNILKPRNMSKISVASISLVILYLTTYFTYTLYPKTDYMVLHLETENQKLEWVNVYKQMQFQYHLSFIVGFIGVSILYYGIC
tara:strand:+ start:1889 stop:2368 length:480 start_codon:yes stop_codon:yes gene_type:complete